MRALLVAALTGLAACATGGTGASAFDLDAMQRQLDARGMGFGLTRIPGEDGVLLQVRFSASAMNDGEPNDGPITEADFRAAAEAAAPQGCRLAALTPAADGAYRADYDCP